VENFWSEYEHYEMKFDRKMKEKTKKEDENEK